MPSSSYQQDRTASLGKENASPFSISVFPPSDIFLLVFLLKPKVNVSSARPQTKAYSCQGKVSCYLQSSSGPHTRTSGNIIEMMLLQILYHQKQIRALQCLSPHRWALLTLNELFGNRRTKYSLSLKSLLPDDTP